MNDDSDANPATETRYALMTTYGSDRNQQTNEKPLEPLRVCTNGPTGEEDATTDRDEKGNAVGVSDGG